jgi:hypothetical protein
MFTYDVTAGRLGFQVSVTGPHPRGTSLIGDLAGGQGVRRQDARDRCGPVSRLACAAA